MNTRNKRASAITVGRPWLFIAPTPDASITAPDRKMITWSYAGIAAASAAFPVDEDAVFTPPAQDLYFVMLAQDRYWTLEAQDNFYEAVD